MNKPNRISILLTPELESILTKVSDLTGQPKTSLIQSALAEKVSVYLELITQLNKPSGKKKKR